jgi:hypothetical protein
MNTDLELVLGAERKRYAVMYELWKVAKDSTQQTLSIKELVKSGIIQEDDVIPVLCYLRDEGLVKDSDLWINFTHKGIVEIERSIKHPDRETEHFSAMVIQHFHASVGIVQTGADSTGNIS